MYPKTEWKYSGDTVEATSYHRGSFEDKTLYIYNKNQQIIQYRSTSNDKIYECTKAYDANGNETECIRKNSGELNIKDSYRCEYVYDKNNNWIKRTTYNVDGSLKSSIERKNRILLMHQPAPTPHRFPHTTTSTSTKKVRYFATYLDC